MIRRSFAVAAIAWAAAIPFAAWLASRPASAFAYAFTALVYKAASFVCHQRPERSFQLSAMQLPVCARCTGIYFGGALAAFAACSRRLKPAGYRYISFDAAQAPGRRAILLVALLPTALTLIYEWTTGDMPSNWIRAVAGAPIGAAVVWLIAFVPEVN